MNNSESFVCFYTTKPFWAVEKPDITAMKKDMQLYHDTLAEEIIKYDDKKNIFSIRVCRDGLIMAQIHELDKERKITTTNDSYYNNESKLIDPRIDMMSKYISYLNVIQLLLDSAISKVKDCRCFSIINLSHKDVFSIISENNGTLRLFRPSQNITSTYYEARTFPDIDIKERYIVIRKEVFETMIADFEKIANDYENKIKILNLVTAAVSEYNSLNFQASIIQAWFVIEYFLKIYNDKFNVTISKKPSKISRGLKNKNYLSEEIFNKIDNVRNKRNDIVHELKNKLSFQDCTEAFDVLKYFIKENWDLEIEFDNGIGYYRLWDF